MAFDKKNYKELKAWMLQQLNSPPWCSTEKCPVEWAKTFLPLISAAVHDEYYEAAQATKDAIREFLNQFLKEPISKSAQLILPAYKKQEIKGILCIADDMFSGHSEII